MAEEKIKIDIWSDIVCPFCYIGKRRFERALEKFEHKGLVEVEWHSFLLDPESKPEKGLNVYDYLAQRKGQSREWSVKAHEHVEQMAKSAGLEYNFDKAIVANSFDAHRLIQLAKTKELTEEAEEALFKAYFTEGRDIGDMASLTEIGTDIGLNPDEVRKMLESNAFAEEVEKDVRDAQYLGVGGVPFFLLINKYGISGAQESELFLDALEQVYEMVSKV